MNTSNFESLSILKVRDEFRFSSTPNTPSFLEIDTKYITYVTIVRQKNVVSNKFIKCDLGEASNLVSPQRQAREKPCV